jgi:hypothetical protein
MKKKRVAKLLLLAPVALLLAPFIHAGCISDEDFSSRYCQMEASCIPWCNCRTDPCECDSNERIKECPTDFTRWIESYNSQGTACRESVNALLECMTSATCSEVNTFFMTREEYMQEGQACIAEFLDIQCKDFKTISYSYGLDAMEPYKELEGFLASMDSVEEIDFERQPSNASSCNPEGSEDFIPNPLIIDDVVFPDPGNPDGGKITMAINQQGTINLPEGIDGVLLVVEGMGNTPFKLKFTFGGGGDKVIQGNAVPGGTAYVGGIRMIDIRSVSPYIVGPTAECPQPPCGPLVISKMYYGQGKW